MDLLKPAWDISRLIWESIQRVKESKRQFGFLAWTIAELLRVLNQGYIAGRLSDLSSTSFIINNLQELLEEIHAFIEANNYESFIKLLFTKERRIAQIDAYQKKIAVMANAFQMSALLDVAKWQEKNDAARAEDQNILYARLDELERDRELLRKTLEAHQQGMVAMIITFQTRLEQHLDGDRERQFFSTSVKYLLTASDRRVEEHDWVVSPSDVQFMEPIASGGFCEILLGRWQGGEVALKILKTVNGITPSSMILQLEINVWSKLRHPHILPFLGANIWGDRPFIVMPYLKNGNARDYIQNYPECNRAAILHQASLGLVYLHSMNIVHADMKGHNILIDGGGKAVLCDFGLSRVKTDINSQSRDAGKEDIHGSINWMAPERLLGRSLRMPSDIYSFGMTIYEVFANDVPFADMHPLYFIQLVARENTRPEKPDADDTFTPEIWALAGRCWAPEPSDRPSATDICDALEKVVAPCISGSTPRHHSTPNTLASLEADPPSIRQGSARQEQDEPSVLDGREGIPPVPSVEVPREIAAKGVEGQIASRPERQQEDKACEDIVSNDLRGAFEPGTSLAKPTLSSDKRQDGSQGSSPLANPISTSERKGSAPVKSASSSGTGRTLVPDEEATKGSSHARPTLSTSPPKRSLLPVEPKYIPSAKDRIVVVMGSTGAGKSTFIEYATQQDGTSIGHKLQSHTSIIRAVMTQHPDDKGPVIFIDTPGFDDTNQSDIEILSQIAGWFVKEYKDHVPLSEIVYLHPISDNKMPGSPLKNLRMFASMCGQITMPRFVLATTMWSDVLPETGARREQNLRGTPWADMISQGCIVERFNDSYQSAWQLVGKLPTERENVIQMYDDKKKLYDSTAVGVKLTEELNRLIADQREGARRLKEQAQMPDNLVLMAELQTRNAEIEKKISGVTAQLQMLKIPFTKKIRNFFISPKTRNSGTHVRR